MEYFSLYLRLTFCTNNFVVDLYEYYSLKLYDLFNNEDYNDK